MRPIDRLISETAAPMLKHLGFRRSGRWFYYQGSTNDVGAIWFQSFDLGAADVGIIGEAELYVRELYEDRGWEWPSKLAGAMAGPSIWRERLLVPPDQRRLGWSTGAWDGDRDDAPPPVEIHYAVWSQSWNIDLDDQPARDTFAAALEELANQVATLTNRDNLVAWLRELDPQGTHPRLGTIPIAEVLSIVKAG